MLDIITASKKRKGLLLLLQNGPKSMDEIKQTLNVNSPGMLPQIRILEKNNLVEREERKYALTHMGQLVTMYLDPLVKILTVFETHEEFWQEHDIECIPFQLLMKIGELGNIQVIEKDIEDIFEPRKDFVETILQCKEVKSIYPIAHPIYFELFLQLAKKNADISLVLTIKAAEKLKNQYNDIFSELLSYSNAKIYISDEDIRTICFVTDRFFSLSLFLKKGIFYPRSELTGCDKSVILWGEELFNYYKDRSRKIEAC
jgi:predicted transcriptional regulator